MAENEKYQNEAYQNTGVPGVAVDDDSMPIGAIMRLLVAGLLVAAVVIFVLQNLDNVPVSFLSWSFDAPLILLLAIAAVAGVLIRWIVGVVLARRKRAK